VTAKEQLYSHRLITMGVRSFLCTKIKDYERCTIQETTRSLIKSKEFSFYCPKQCENYSIFVSTSKELSFTCLLHEGDGSVIYTLTHLNLCQQTRNIDEQKICEQFLE